MNDKKHAQPGHCSTIKWGAIIAGAAIVVGAVLFYPPVVEVIPKIFTSIGEWIASVFTNLSTAAPAVANAAAPVIEKTAEQIAAEAAKSEAAREAMWTMIQKVGGAALFGGGLAYFLGGKREHNQPVPNPEVAESFAMKEDMRKMQALMVMRTAYAGNPQAQRMLEEQQQGRA